MLTLLQAKERKGPALIPDLQDVVAYTAFLNGLLPCRLKFSLAKNKAITLADA